ncbi:hypothetical protein L0663_18090 [Dyadobacter sp. CY107]|uniref:hypothetical protein n=1 Tax=Dyadobacter fanqingshengii TaxID=2906443 RepID=UPI001F31D971|nr:hypothetical protein [Dyadobacter fanqingshengii]MCF2505308.1 hypothetical protein [Dyadobacter fanqingshengii]
MSNIPNEVLVWEFSGKPGNLKSVKHYQSNQAYSMFCTTNKHYLTWGDQSIGINLVWQKEAKDKKIHFHLPDNTERDIKTGEKLAFAIGGGEAFLYYAERAFGINLKWQEDLTNSMCQWRIFGKSGRAGEPIRPGEKYAIINENVKPEPDFLVYLDRIHGQADIGWTTSPNRPKNLVGKISKYVDIAGEVLKKAAVVAPLVI